MIGLILQTWTMKTEDLLSKTDLKEPSGDFSVKRNARFLRITFAGVPRACGDQGIHAHTIIPFVFQEHARQTKQRTARADSCMLAVVDLLAVWHGRACGPTL